MIVMIEMSDLNLPKMSVERFYRDMIGWFKSYSRNNFDLSIILRRDGIIDELKSYLI